MISKMSENRYFNLEVATREGGKCDGVGCGERRDTLYVLSRHPDTGAVTRKGCFVCVVKQDRDIRIEKRIIQALEAL